MPKKVEVIPFRGSKCKIKSTEGTIVESGTIGTKPALTWEVFAPYGTIHIYDKNLTFKKDCDKFEDELAKIPLNLKVGQKHVIKGSGDNDDLIITNEDGEYRLSLTRRGIAVVEKLKELISKAKLHKTK